VSTPLRLLVAEDLPPDAELIIAEVRRSGYEPTATVVDTAGKFLRALEDDPEIIICDYTMPTMTAPDALAILREKAPDLPLIVVSGSMDEATCVNSLRLGAVDYLLKDRLSRLGPAIAHALQRRELDRSARAAEREREATMNILRGLVTNATAAINVSDLNGVTLVSNDRYLRLFENTESTPGSPSEGPALPAMVDPRQVIEREEQFDIAGQARTYYATRYPVVDAESKVFAVGSILVDITRQKRIEDDLRTARLELEERAEHLDLVNAELREVDRLKTEFVASVSHELRTPLTSIRGYAELLLDDASEDENQQQTRMLGIIDRNARRLLSLVEDLLLLSKVDSQTLAHRVEPVDLAEVANGAVVVLQPAMENAGVAIVLDVTPPMLVQGDRSQLERVLFNLLSNAIKFSHRGDSVTIGGRVEPAQVVLTIRDTGIGVSAEELPKLFTRFFRSAADAAHNIPGTGLGLAVVREIIENHGGTVTMDSVQGVGSTVTVILPVKPET
jgi:signal transduction histidine kinase